MLFVIIIIIAAAAAYLLSLAPNLGRKEKMADIVDKLIAHRGLFDASAPENSMPAFRKALQKGYGIELDVQLTTDGELIVFHDENIERMCGKDVVLRHCTYEQTRDFRLGATDEKIPRLKDVLDEVSGRVPLIIEIKPEGNWKKTSEKLAEMMDDYKGFYCVQSFHPLALEWFRKKRPDIIRGQLSTDFIKDHIDRKWYERIIMTMLTNLMFNFKSKPDFISYNLVYANQFSLRLCRKLYKAVYAAWTIRSREEFEKAKKNFQVFIFDEFPEQAN